MTSFIPPARLLHLTSPALVAAFSSAARLLRRTRHPMLVALIVAVLLGACRSSTSPSETPIGSALMPSASPPSMAPPTANDTPSASLAWQQVLTQIGPDGTVTVETALQAFSLAFGPLPGVTVPTGPVGSIRSGSGAIRWLVGHWDEITDAQRAEAVRLIPELGGIGAAPSAHQLSPDLALVSFTRGVLATTRPPTYYTVLAQTMADEIESHTHLHLDLTIFAAEGTTVLTTSAAETVVLNARGGNTGQAAQCVIVISPGGAAQPVDILENMMGHEVWHCYQGQIRGLNWYYSTSTPSWLIEGQAEWVGDALRPTAAAPAWADYITNPGKPLFSRSYDALGFYAHLMRSQINTWDVLIPMLQASDNNVARYEASGATSDQFLDTWASSFVRDPAVGPAWELEGPGLPAGPGAMRPVLPVTNGKATAFGAPAYANSVFSLSSSADIIVFTVEGHARLGDPGNNQEYILVGGSFCTKAGGCTCPPGTAFAGAPPMPLSAETLLAITGGPAGAHGTATGYSLDEFCHKEADGQVWSMVFWSPDLGESAPPLLAAYTCDGLDSTWKVIYLPGSPSLERAFELPFDAELVVHQDIHYDIPADKQSNAQELEYAIDFELDPTSKPPVIKVTGTKTESEGAQSRVFAPREFGSDAPLELKNVSLETQLKPYPQYQHPFRAQAFAECGG